MFTTGSRLGPYEVISAIGAGGMGEVWRARDTRLDRDVAIKILPPSFAESIPLRARFEREAKAISSLNHPHICTLHDVGQENGVHYLVMELLEGESLADRLGRGPLPPEQVLRLGAQIATALDTAHRRGIVHRDLKPGNIMLTKSGAKLLDFGLAKTGADVSADALTQQLTAAKPLTAEGTIVGTFQYMAPEQLEGVPADSRTDIWALGAVLYEMATGRRAFEGRTKTSLIASIVSAQPAPVASVVPTTPAALDHVIRKCLEKDPDERWQSAQDVASELRWIAESGAQPGAHSEAKPKRRSRTLFLAALTLAGWAAASWVGYRWWQERERSARLLRPFRSDLVLPAGVTVGPVMRGAMALSPDARRLAFVTRLQTLVVHDFAAGATRVLEGTADATYPFWSPDGEWLAFFAGGKLKKISPEGGPVQVICDAVSGRGGTWSTNGTIVFAPDLAGGLMRVADTGGTPSAATKTKDGRWTHRNPHFLPDGDHFVFTVRESRRESFGAVGVAALSSPEVRIVAEKAANPQFAGGWLFFVRDTNLVAQPFDLESLQAGGTPQAIADRLEFQNPRDLGQFTVSRTGTIAFLQTMLRPVQLTWVDREGRELAAVGEPATYIGGRMSAAATLAALVRKDEAGEETIWAMDLKRQITARATSSAAAGFVRAIVSSDGTELLVSNYAASGLLSSRVWTQAPSASGAHREIIRGTSFMAQDWSRDGKIIIGGTQEIGTGFDIAWLSLDDPKRLHSFIATRYEEQHPRLSPDGRWLAYTTNETGAWETYISDFPAAKNRWQVSRAGGRPIAWNPDGKELLIGIGGTLTSTGGGPVLVVPVKETVPGMVEIGAPQQLPLTPDRTEIVGFDGKRLLILKPLSDARAEPVRLVHNWTTR